MDFALIAFIKAGWLFGQMFYWFIIQPRIERDDQMWWDACIQREPQPK